MLAAMTKLIVPNEENVKKMAHVLGEMAKVATAEMSKLNKMMTQGSEVMAQTGEALALRDAEAALQNEGQNVKA